MVLVVVDTLRADHLGAWGYARPTSPHLDAWAARGRLFERAFATSAWTVPSFASLYTGTLPARHAAGYAMLETGREGVSRMAADVRTLAEAFRDAGYGTAAVATNPFLAPGFALDRGFDHYDHDGTGDGRRAAETVDRALARIDTFGAEPYFVLVHLFDPHVSYDPPPAARGRFTAGTASRLRLPIDDPAGAERAGRLGEPERRFVAAAYDEEVAYVDGQLERLRRGLEARGVFARGLVALTSDHGEELFDHGGFEHGHAMWQELLHVPLVFWGAGVRPGRERAAVSLVDVAPTLLEAAGLAHGAPLDGVSLWPNLHAGAAVAERTLFAEANLYAPGQRAALRWPHKLVLDLASGERRLVDLEADPAEATDLSPSRPELAERLAREMARHLGEAPPAAERLVRAAPDPEVRAALRALGYLEH